VGTERGGGKPFREFYSGHLGRYRATAGCHKNDSLPVDPVVSIDFTKHLIKVRRLTRRPNWHTAIANPNNAGIHPLGITGEHHRARMVGDKRALDKRAGSRRHCRKHNKQRQRLLQRVICRRYKYPIMLDLSVYL